MNIHDIWEHVPPEANYAFEHSSRPGEYYYWWVSGETGETHYHRFGDKTWWPHIVQGQSFEKLCREGIRRKHYSKAFMLFLCGRTCLDARKYIMAALASKKDQLVFLTTVFPRLHYRITKEDLVMLHEFFPGIFEHPEEERVDGNVREHIRRQFGISPSRSTP